MDKRYWLTNHHLDIMIPTESDFQRGDIVKVKIVGVFLRSDGDYKIVGIEMNRPENNFDELPEKEIKNLKQIYPNLQENEGWFGREIAEKVVNEFIGKKN